MPKDPPKDPNYDRQFAATMELLGNQRQMLLDIDRLNNNSLGQKAIAEDMNATIQALDKKYKAAQNDEERKAICSGVAELANGFQAMAQASISLAGAVKSGDPFAISAASLDLAASLIGTVSLAGGPIGAAVGAVLGAILSIVSMILKMFQTEAESLLSQIEKMERSLRGESQIEGLQAASTHIKAFTGAAIKAYSKKTQHEFSGIMLILNQNTVDEMGKTRAWLENAKNQELKQWGEALAVLCQTYASFKIGLAYWLPVVDSKVLAQLMDVKDSYDSGMLSFLNTIKPAARNRGIICHAGTAGVYVRDKVISPDPKWTQLKGNAYAAVGVYRRARPGKEASPYPPLSIFHLGGNETFDTADRASFNGWRHQTVANLETKDDKQGRSSVRSAIRKVKLHPFSKKSRAYDHDGHWPLGPIEPGEWDKLDDIKEVYDIWAIRGEAEGEIDVYTSTGSTINLYTEKGGVTHIKLKRENPTAASYKAGAVRAVKPKALPNTEVVYQLCEDAKATEDYPFKIWAFFMTPPGSGGWVAQGSILPPRQLGLVAEDWRNFPIGIAVDNVHFWVFSTCFIACVSHTTLKEHLQKALTTPPAWMVYSIPSEVLGYDPIGFVSWGLSDLSACDDGTLTALFDPHLTSAQSGVASMYGLGSVFGHIYTATPRFEAGKLIIDGTDVDDRDQEVKTHGWVKDPTEVTRASRVHKLPIFCWPLIEGLEDMLMKEAAAADAAAPKPSS